jgi:hypothetical protein
MRALSRRAAWLIADAVAILACLAAFIHVLP